MKRATYTVHRIPIAKAGNRLGRVAERIHARKEYFVLEEDGVALAGGMSMDEFEDYLELQDSGLKKQIAEGYAEYCRGEAEPIREFLARLARKTRTNSKKR